MSAPLDPTSLPVAQLFAELAGAGRWPDAYRLALQLRDFFGYDAADALWRGHYGRGLNDEE